MAWDEPRTQFTLVFGDVTVRVGAWRLKEFDVDAIAALASDVRRTLYATGAPVAIEIGTSQLNVPADAAMVDFAVATSELLEARSRSSRMFPLRPFAAHVSACVVPAVTTPGVFI